MLVTVVRMRGRRRATHGAIVIAVLACSLAACTPEPAPSPTPTGFASEEEAFAAAEATYRAYVDALNEVDLSDPATFEPVFALLVDEYRLAEQQQFHQYHSDGAVVSGVSIPELIESFKWVDERTVSVAGCINVSDVQLHNAAGASLVAPDRPAIQSTLATVRWEPSSPTGAGIAAITGRAGEPAC